jgi:sporulation related protein
LSAKREQLSFSKTFSAVFPIRKPVMADITSRSVLSAVFAPDKKFLQKITKSGYSYIIHDAKVNGVSMTKVLVGPYATDKAARKDLPSVRSKIEPGAFLSRI